jgi:hypothetical protein
MCYSVVLVCFLTALYFLYAISFPFSLSNPGVNPKDYPLRLKTIAPSSFTNRLPTTISPFNPARFFF